MMTIFGPLIAVGATGCGQPEPIDITRVGEELSRIILQPSTTCEQLRTEFGVEYLPLARNPGDIGLAFEENWISNARAQSLRVWYLPARLDRGTIILSNGSSGPMSCYLFTARLLVNNGWSVVMYDYEGFGGSTGVPSIDALIPDLEAAVEFARWRCDRERVTVYGISLGCIPSVAVAAERPDAVNAVVLDSPVALGQEIGRFGFLVAGSTAVIFDAIDTRLVSEWMISRITQPVLIFLHEEDYVTPPSDTELLFSLVRSAKTLVRVPSLGHASGVFFGTDLYTKGFEEFLWITWFNESRTASRDLLHIGE